jgi:hypothetical protein
MALKPDYIMARFLRLVVVFIVFSTCYTAADAQKSILIEPQKRKINQDVLLPAQAYFNMQVPVNNSTGRVEVNIYKGKTAGNLLEKTAWTRPVNFAGDMADLPVDTKLKSNSNYTFEVTVYNLLGDSERTHLRELLHQHITNYLDATIETDNARLDLARKPAQMRADLDNIVIKSMVRYQNLQGRVFEGFYNLNCSRLLMPG